MQFKEQKKNDTMDKILIFVPAISYPDKRLKWQKWVLNPQFHLEEDSPVQALWEQS